MAKIIRYTDSSNVDLLGYVIDRTKVYGIVYHDTRQLNTLLKIAKKENKIILSY